MPSNRARVIGRRAQRLAAQVDPQLGPLRRRQTVHERRHQPRRMVISQHLVQRRRQQPDLLTVPLSPRHRAPPTQPQRRGRTTRVRPSRRAKPSSETGSKGCPYREMVCGGVAPRVDRDRSCRGSPWSQSQKSGFGGMPEPPPDRGRVGDGAILGLMRQAPRAAPTGAVEVHTRERAIAHGIRVGATLVVALPRSPAQTRQSQRPRSPTRRLSGGRPGIPPNHDSCGSHARSRAGGGQGGLPHRLRPTRPAAAGPSRRRAPRPGPRRAGDRAARRPTCGRAARAARASAG